MNSMDMKSRLAGIRKFLLPRSRSEDLLVSSGSARALFGPTPESAAGEKGRDLVDFLKQVHLFKDFRRETLNGLHELSMNGHIETVSTSMNRGIRVWRFTSCEAASSRSQDENAMVRKCHWPVWNRLIPSKSWRPWETKSFA